MTAKDIKGYYKEDDVMNVDDYIVQLLWKRNVGNETHDYQYYVTYRLEERKVVRLKPMSYRNREM
jgi:hypothetical protein